MTDRTGFDMKQNPLLLLLLFGLAGCSSIVVDGAPGGAENTVRSIALEKPLVLPNPVGMLQAAVYFVTDPLSPGWRIEESRIGENRYRIELRRKRFATGGDGEATQVFYRRAEQIVRNNGSAGYTVIEFGEGIDSMFPVSQRFAQGVIQVR